MSVIGRIALAGIFAVGLTAQALASSIVVDGLTGAGSTGTEADTNGESLWSLTGGAAAFSLASYPPSDNTKNEVLQYYVVATGSNGSSVFSLGELSGSGFGNSTVNIQISNGQTSLVDSSAPQRNVTNLTSLQIMAVPALFHGAEGVQSTSVAVSGGSNPGTYNLSQLQSFAASHGGAVSAGTSPTYTGISLSTLLGLSGLSLSAVLDGIVVTQGTDGYEVVLAAAELDPALGGNANDILAYLSTGGDFPDDGLARTIFLTDSKKGRWESNLDGIEFMSATPLPSTWTMMLVGLTGLGFVGYRQSKKATLSAAA
jgi:hypothetical protein